MLLTIICQSVLAPLYLVRTGTPCIRSHSTFGCPYLLTDQSSRTAGPVEQPTRGPEFPPDDAPRREPRLDAPLAQSGLAPAGPARPTHAGITAGTTCNYRTSSTPPRTYATRQHYTSKLFYQVWNANTVKAKYFPFSAKRTLSCIISEVKYG